jgi:hypothetical protein
MNCFVTSWNLLRRAQVDLARAEVNRRQNVDTELVARHLLEFGSDRAVEGLLQVVRVAEQVGGGEDRPGWDLLGDVLRRDVAHLEVAALHGDELGALLEQRAAEEVLDVEATTDLLAEHPERLGADVLVADHRSKAKFRLRLCEDGGGREQCCRSSTGGKNGTAGK